MPQRTIHDGHRWIFAAEVEIDEAFIRRALARRTHTLPAETKICVLDVYCGECRRNYVDVAELDCAAAKGNEHLIGGPTGKRRRRAPIPVPSREIDLEAFLEERDDLVHPADKPVGQRDPNRPATLLHAP